MNKDIPKNEHELRDEMTIMWMIFGTIEITQEHDIVILEKIVTGHDVTIIHGPSRKLETL